MALVVEDGSIVSGANSYTSLVDAQAFIDERGLDVTLTEGHLLRSLDAQNALEYIGCLVDAAQALPFPRQHYNYINTHEFVYGNTNCSVKLDPDTIPTDIIAAQIWGAYYIAEGNDPATVQSAGVIREKVDVLEVEYAEAQVMNGIKIENLPNVGMNLKKYLKANSRKIGRA